MFFLEQSRIQKDKYKTLLKIIGALSRLSSNEVEIPYLYYRMAENTFCRAFGAKNLSRSDISIDASKDDIGIGIKTFLHKNGQPSEKIAEFNKERTIWANSNTNELKIQKISQLRNERVKSTATISGISENKMVYHCIARTKSKFLIFETPIKLINTEKINITNVSNNVITFEDGMHKYSFNLSKSTLFKKFEVDPVCEINIRISEDPFELLEQYFKTPFSAIDISVNPIVSTICLPLYSERKGINVPEKSGLNQWNASGRCRDYNEIYIPIPSLVRDKYPCFFPKRDATFILNLPDGQFLHVKVCQDGDKALMSNPNSALGEWLLRDVLGLKYGELLTYERLQIIGIDTVEINKFKDNTYEINFKKLGAYELFKDICFNQN